MVKRFSTRKLSKSGSYHRREKKARAANAPAPETPGRLYSLHKNAGEQMTSAGKHVMMEKRAKTGSLTVKD